VGLDLVVEGRPRAGHEAEWRRILERAFGDGEPQAGDVERFNEISVPPHVCVGAPRVGYDRAADEWIIEAGTAETPDEIERMLEEMRGYYVLRLVECDGIPRYSNAGAYDGVDETSFRGSFLSDCTDVLGDDLIADAWNHKFPEEAVAYGAALLAAADSAPIARPAPEAPEPKRGLFSFLRPKRETKPASPLPLDEQLDIVRSAGLWYQYWGERGHAIRAWF